MTDRWRRRALFASGFVLAVVAIAVGPQIVAAIAAFLSNAGPISGGGVIAAPQGPHANLTESMTINLSDPPDAHELEIRSSAGNVSLRSAVATNLTITQINGTWTNVSAIDTNGTTLMIDPGDKQRVNVSGQLDAIDFQSVVPEDQAVDFVYAGDSGTTTVTLTGLSPNTQYGAAEPATGTLHDVATSDGNGDVTFTLPNSEHAIAVETGDAPSANNASASPTGELTTDTPTLSIDVTDPDFATGDSVTVNWYVGGDQISTETISSNGTVTHTVNNNLVGGETSWHVELEDGFGLTGQSKVFNISVPSTIQIREESEPHPLVKNATAFVGIFGSNETLDRRTVTDGNISLAGLDVTETYVVVVEAENYTLRQGIIVSIFDQEAVFVANLTSETLVETRFRLDDRTGQYSSPTMYLQKAINRSLYDPNASTEYQWTNVAGDRLGADSDFTTDLIKNDRYRIVVENADGDKRILGEYTARNAREVQLTIESVGIVLDKEEANVAYGAQQTGEGADAELKIAYNDTVGETNSLRVVIHEWQNRSNEIENTTFAGPLGSFQFSKNLSAQQANTSWVVELQADRGGSEPWSVRLPIGAGQQPLLPPIPWPFPQIGGMAIILVTPALVGGRRAETGAVLATLLGAIMWYVGVLPAVVNAITIAFAIMVAVWFKMRSRQGAVQ